jgi:hypothetical protein
MRRRTVSKKTGNGDDGALILNPRERERERVVAVHKQKQHIYIVFWFG